jgi:hypothetical protein
MLTGKRLPAITLRFAAASFTIAATAALRGMGGARPSPWAQLTGSAAYAIGDSTEAVYGGALGPSWRINPTQAFVALLWWNQLRSALTEHLAVREGER